MIVINGKNYKELRCKECQKFVIYHNIAAGTLFWQCPKCGNVNEWVFKFMNTKANRAEIDKSFVIDNPDPSPAIPQ